MFPIYCITAIVLHLTFACVIYYIIKSYHKLSKQLVAVIYHFVFWCSE